MALVVKKNLNFEKIQINGEEENHKRNTTRYEARLRGEKENPTRSLFLKMVGDFVVGRTGNYGDCSEGLDALLHLARIHSLEAMVYYMLKEQREKLKTKCPDQVRNMQNAYNSAISMAVSQETGMAEIEETFRNAGIRLVFFKGAQLRALYSVPELRTMGDLDCLICPEDREKAHRLMCQLGYKRQEQEGAVWVYSMGTIVVEMHTKIARNGLGNGFDYQEFFSDAMEHTKMQNGKLCFEGEYHVCYLIYHIAKHLSSTGAGVRMIADIAAILHCDQGDIDWEFVQCQLEQAQLWETALAIYGLCNRWFGIDTSASYRGPEWVLDALEAYIVSGGTFGFELRGSGDIYRRNALRESMDRGWHYRLRLMCEYLFPSKAYLTKYFPPSEKHGWLLPVAWLRRCWLGAFRRKHHSIATIRSMTDGDADRSYWEGRMLKEIGL